MPFPPNLPLVTLRGRILSPGVDSDRPTDAVVARHSRVRLVFTPSVATIPAPAADPAPLLIHTRGMPKRIEGVTDSDGYLCTPDPDNPDLAMFRGVRLLPTDLDEFSVKDWTWHIEERSLDGKTLFRAYDIAVPKAAVESGLDLTNLVPVPATEGYGIPQAEAAAAAAAQDAQAARELSVQDATLTDGVLRLVRGDGTVAAEGDITGPQGGQGDKGDPGLPGITDLATPTTSGIMSAADKVKVDTIGQLSATQYGAKGTGIGDDTTALQDLIAAATSQGKTAFVPAGTYRVTDVLRSTGPGLKLVLADGATIKRDHLNNMFVNGPAGATNGHGRIDISGGTWDANGLVRADFGSVFALGAAADIYVHDLHAKNVCKSHIVEIAALTRANFERVRFSGYTDPTGTRDYAEAFQFERITATGFPAFVNDTNAPNVTVTIRNCTQVDPDAGYSRWPVAVGSHAIDTSGSFNTGIVIDSCDFGVCTRNVLRIMAWEDVRVSKVSGTAPAALSIEMSAQSFTQSFSACNLVSTNSAAVSMSNAGGATFTGCKLAGQTNGFTLTGALNVTMVGNTVTAATLDAFATLDGTRACSGLTISQNRIPSARAGVYAQGATTAVTIVGNDFQALTNHGVSLAGTSGGVIVEGNSFVLPAGNRVVNFAATAGKAGIGGNKYPTATTTFQNGTAAQALVGTNYPM